MKIQTIILSVFVLLNLCTLNAQQLVQEGNQWNIAIWPTFDPNTRSYSLRIAEDTIINNQTYHTVYRSSDSLGNEWNLTSIFLRQDSTKKVFRYHSNGDQLLYDFDLEVGDVVDNGYSNCQLTVTAIDTVMLTNGELRKRWKLSNDPIYGYTYWVDGIGTNYALEDSFSGHCVFDYADGFLCFYSNEEQLYPVDPWSCFVVATKELPLDSNVRVYPNPIKTQFIIEDERQRLSSYTLFTITGQQLKTGSVTNVQTQVNTADIPSGLYFLLLEDDKGNSYSVRLTK
jgi:hypothetical protein